MQATSFRKKLLRIKTTAIGLVGLHMLASKALVVKFLFAKAVLIEWVLLGLIATLPTLATAHNATVYITNEAGQIEIYDSQGQPLYQPGDLITKTKQTDNVFHNHPVNEKGIGKTTLKGVDDPRVSIGTTTLKGINTVSKGKTTLKGIDNVSVGKTTLVGIDDLANEASKHEVAPATHSAIGNTTLKGTDHHQRRRAAMEKQQQIRSAMDTTKEIGTTTLEGVDR